VTAVFWWCLPPRLARFPRAPCCDALSSLTSHAEASRVAVRRRSGWRRIGVGARVGDAVQQLIVSDERVRAAQYKRGLSLMLLLVHRNWRQRGFEFQLLNYFLRCCLLFAVPPLIARHDAMRMDHGRSMRRTAHTHYDWRIHFTNNVFRWNSGIFLDFNAGALRLCGRQTCAAAADLFRNYKIADN
jgi:hypothetical protein